MVNTRCHWPARRSFAATVALVAVLAGGLTGDPGAAAAQPPEPNPVTYGAVIAGVPGETVAELGDRAGQGMVEVMLADGSVQSLDQSDPGHAAGSDAPGRAGTAVAHGDFDGDGYDDVVSGSPDERMGGAVRVTPGSATGLDASATQRLAQAGPIPGIDETGDRFGAALAVGDFDGDGYDDLAIGVPDEDLGEITDAGVVIIVPGGAGGLRTAASRSLHQRGPIAGTPEPGDGFGAALAAGDFDDDGHDDLAIGVPEEDLGGTVDAGMVAVVMGGPSGLRPGPFSLTQRGPLAGTPEAGDTFGTALTAVDLDGDGNDDLVVGVPGEDIGNVADAGMVNVTFGSSGGLVAGPTQLHQAGPTPGAAENGDRFGSSLAGGDLDGDGLGDLAVGVPGEDLGTTADAGLVNLAEGTSTQTLLAGAAISRDLNTPYQQFGRAVAIGRVDTDSYDDLAVGIPGADSPSEAGAGAVEVYDGSAAAISDEPRGYFSSNDREGGDRLGSALSIATVAPLPAAPGDQFDDTGQVVGVGGTYAVISADLDGDGDLDLVETAGGAASFHLNDGSGHFTDTGVLAEGLPLGFLLSAAVGDIDGDGDLDLAGSRVSVAPIIVRNDGGMTWTDTGQVLVGAGYAFRAAFVDVDGDGDADLVEPGLNQASGTQVYLNDGAGMFAGSGQTLPQSIFAHVADLDGDGDADLVLTGGSPTVLRNDGSGEFSEEQVLASNGDRALATGDVDGDGDIDVVHGPQIFGNDGDATFSETGQSLGSGATWHVLLDVDLDGDLDVVQVRHRATTQLWLNDGSGNFQLDTEASFGGHNPVVVGADLDGDGDDDLIVGAQDRPLKIWRNTTVE